MSPDARSGIFPLPLVPGPRPTKSRSRRVRQRHRRAAVTQTLSNQAIVSLNSLHNSLSPDHHRQSSNNITHTQLRAVAHISDCVSRYVSRLAPAWSGAWSGDSLPVCDKSGSPHGYASTAQSEPIQADRVALPESPKFINLLDNLPQSIAEAYATPRADLFRPLEERKRAPRAVSVASPTDYIRLIQRLDRLTMISYTTQPKCVNGVFATAKSDGMQRLIDDCRPANAAFSPSPEVDLPTPDLLAHLSVDARDIYVAKVDLDNYYHRIKLPEWLHPYFVPCLLFGRANPSLVT